ncbi:MAG: DUF3800 domain-containing protein [Gammaproteobacteria bacterium]|nr:DUF3800 domain-containing protein [Gammaproteobacteria bacterium]
MYLCYVDESGTSDLPGSTSHFILAGIVLPIWHWKSADEDIRAIKRNYGLDGAEIHTGWILRKYHEQSKVIDFEKLDYHQRRIQVEKLRHANLLDSQSSPSNKKLKQLKKNYKQTNAYIHLSYDERRTFINEIAECVSNWGFARLFAECVNKLHFDPHQSRLSVDGQAFEQLVSRFERYLQNLSSTQNDTNYGLIVHDNNRDIARKHTDMMIRFHNEGTFWIDIKSIIETPLYVDSQLTSMVQVADLCAYALRRYLENREIGLFERIYKRADRLGSTGPVVGIRHFTDNDCDCNICVNHRIN